jgi:hypothetical protein
MVPTITLHWKLIWRLMTKLLLAAIATILLSGAAHAEEPMQCSPKDNTVRILKSANPNDTAPGWKLAIVPAATSFAVKRTVDTDAGKYFQGDLISTRGGKIGRNLFILAQEWDCKGS